MKKQRRRFWIQLGAAALSNGYLKGYWTGRIYQGSLKKICVPGMNCYSCPGALGACPLGSLQNSLYDVNQIFPFYILGLLVILGSILGRAICGFLCPFGFLQDLMAKIPIKKIRLKERWPRLDQGLRWVKWVNLSLLVFLLPLGGRFIGGLASPWFCKMVCPAGTLGAGWPLMLLQPNLRSSAGLLFGWKSFLALLVIGLCLIVHRFFCRYLCPLGAFYGLFNPISFIQLRYQPDSCIHCSRCAKVCPMEVEMPRQKQSVDCIRCGLCANQCPKGCLQCGGGQRISISQQLFRPQPGLGQREVHLTPRNIDRSVSKGRIKE